jgi:hypothetical protein
MFPSEPPDTEHACLPEDVIELLTDVEQVGSEWQQNDNRNTGVEELCQNTEAVVILSCLPPEFFWLKLKNTKAVQFCISNVFLEKLK